MALAPKNESQALFDKLKRKDANQKCADCSANNPTWASVAFAVYLCLDCSAKHRHMGVHISFVRSTNLDQWQWNQLRRMKVGGNESAIKYFQSHGGSAALASKDPKVKYTSSAANKYKDELARRVEMDTKKNPDSVILDDAEYSEGTGTNTPNNESTDDFFSSWDKPSIKRPSNPPSRTGTPAAQNASPFLTANANGNGAGRPKSPLVNVEAPPTNRTTSTSALRTGAAGARPKASILGGKSKSKLGAKKVDASALDFDAAEKKANEEAERKERLGYDPDEEAPPAEAQTTSAQPTSKPTIHSPTPVIPERAGGFGQTGMPKDGRDTNLSMGFRRLGFGQVGGGVKVEAPKTRAAVVDDSQTYAREKFTSQKGISSDEFFGRGNFDPSAQSEAKSRLQGFEGSTSISSNAYFGRPEEEEGAGDYGDLETAARDMVRKFGITAGDDLENLSSLLGEGATKLQGAIRNYLNG